MQTKDAALALIHVMILLLFFGAGVFFLGLLVAPSMRFALAHAFLYKDSLLSILGMAFLFLSFLLLLGFYGLHHKRFFSVRMKQHPLDVDSSIIKSYIESYLMRAHPEKVKQISVSILPNQRIEITASLASMNTQQQREFLETSEREIGKILADVLDYDREFFFRICL